MSPQLWTLLWNHALTLYGHLPLMYRNHVYDYMSHLLSVWNFIKHIKSTQYKVCLVSSVPTPPRAVAQLRASQQEMDLPLIPATIKACPIDEGHWLNFNVMPVLILHALVIGSFGCQSCLEFLFWAPVWLGSRKSGIQEFCGTQNYGPTFSLMIYFFARVQMQYLW